MLRPRSLVSSWIKAILLFLVCCGSPTNAQASTSADDKRNIVILLDNHIFTDQAFKFDEAVLRRNIRAMLEYVRPRRAVAFAVGHDGHAQYPSRIFPSQTPSAQYPLLQGPPQDLLQLWREETERTDTELIIYVSTLRSDALAALRPDYLRVFMNGAKATVIDHNTGFIDEILLPGLQELIERYDPDGFFLDADYWTVHESWNKASTDKFEARFGVPAPKDYADPSYKRFVEFTYDSYRNDYVEKLSRFFAKQSKPLNWAINAAFTFRDPSPVPENYGTITSDLPFFALGEAYVESLFGQRQQKESEIVYALFAQSEGVGAIQYKSAAQLRQELAVAIANRSLVSFYLPLGNDGTISLGRIEPAIRAYDEIERSVGVDPKKPDDHLIANVALINVNADAVSRRDFSALRSLSLQLFENGTSHSIISDSLAKNGRFSHLIFPSMNEVVDPGLLPALGKEGKQVLWTLNRAQASPSALKAIETLREANDLRLVQLEECDECEMFRSSSGGEIWIVPEPSKSDALSRFLSGARQAVNFPDKPKHVYALAYQSSNGQTTIYLSSVAWGGAAFGRHTVFDTVDVIAPITIQFERPRQCRQHGPEGITTHAVGTTLRTSAFDAVTKIVCEN